MTRYPGLTVDVIARMTPFQQLALWFPSTGLDDKAIRFETHEEYEAWLTKSVRN